MDQVNLNIAHVGGLTQIIMAHKSVEIDRGAGTDIILVTADLGDRFKIRGDLLGDPCRLFKSCTFRHIDNNLKFILVVERQHFHLHGFERNQNDRPGQQKPDSGKCDQAHKAVVEQRRENIFKQPVVTRLRDVILRVPSVLYLQQPVGEPRRYDQSYQKRKDHSQRSADRHRAHIGAHQAGNEHHRENGGDNRKGRKNGGVADLADRCNGGLKLRLPFHGKMAMDVLGDDDRIVNNDTGHKNQREKRYPVQ